MRLKRLYSRLLTGVTQFMGDENGIFGIDDMLIGGLALGGVGGFLGGLFGKSSTSSVSVEGPGANENEATNIEQEQLRKLRELTAAGPGQSDIERSLASQRGLSALLAQYAQSGGLPSAADIGTTNGLAANLFAARRTALNQEFADQDIASQQLAARLNRTADDPILRSRLLTQRSRMLDSLNAEQTGLSSQIALGLADRRVGYAQGAAGVDAALAAQALSNRASLLGLGSQVANRHAQFRLGTATRTNEQPGGLGPALGGLLAGAGSGAMIGGLFSNAFAQAAPSITAGLNFSQPLAPQIAAPMQSFQAPVFGQSAPGYRTFSLGGQ